MSMIHIIEQYSLRPKRLLARVGSNFNSCEAALLGVDGLDEARDEGLLVEDLGEGLVDDEADEDLLVDRLTDGLVLVDFFADVEAAVDFLLTPLVGLTGVLKSVSPPTEKLSSLIGDTEDRLFMADFLVEAELFLVLDLLLAGVELFFFFMDDGVDLGLGVPLIGLDDLLAGVAVALAMVKKY